MCDVIGKAYLSQPFQPAAKQERKMKKTAEEEDKVDEEEVEEKTEN